MDTLSKTLEEARDFLNWHKIGEAQDLSEEIRVGIKGCDQDELTELAQRTLGFARQSKATTAPYWVQRLSSAIRRKS